MNKLILSVLAIASTATGFTAMAELPSSVSGNDNRTLYTIKSVDTARGMLYASTTDGKAGSAGATHSDVNSYDVFKSVSISNPAENANLQFAIITFNGKSYLFNAGAQKFCYNPDNNDIEEKASNRLFLSDTEYSTIDFEANGSGYLMHIDEANKISFSNNPNGFGAIFVAANDHHGIDDGDRVVVTKLDGVTLSDEAYAKALKVIAPSLADEHADEVGYPTAAARQTLLTAIDEATTGTAIESAITAYQQSTDVVLPADGAAYKIKARFRDGSTRYLYHNGTRLAQTESAADAEVFVCKQDAEGAYTLFSHNRAQFLTYYADGKTGINGSTSGFTSVYEANGHAATVQFSHPHTNTYGTSADVTSEMFGTLAIQAFNTFSSDNNTFYLTAGKGGDFHNAGRQDVFCTNSGNLLTSYYEFEEVEHPHTVAATAQHAAFNHVALYVGTYAVVLPEGVTAWYVSAVKNPAAATEADEIMTLAEANDGEVGLTRLGSVVPANFPVLLSSNSADATAMRPATIEELPQVSAVDNKLTVNTDQSVTTGHVLDSDGNFSEGTLAANGIMLKDAAAGTTYIVKDAGELTSIANVTADTETAPVQYFDLQGRRLSAPSRGICINSRGEKILIRK